MARKRRPKLRIYKHGRQRYYQFHLGGRCFRGPVGDQDKVSEEEARRAAEKILENTLAQFNRPKRRERPNPIDAYVRSIRDGSISHQENVARFWVRLTDYFGRDRDLRTIRKEDVAEWQDWLLHEAPRKDIGKGERGLSPKTVKEHIDWLASVYRYNDMDNPCARVKRPRRSERERQEALEFFTPDEMKRLFAVTMAENPGVYNALIFYALTGCRDAEARGLRPEDLDHDRQAVWLTGKGDIPRQIILTGDMQPAWNALLRQMKDNPRLDGYIFPQGATWARKWMARISKNAFGVDRDEKPIRHGHPHMLRHSFATAALLHWKGWDIARLAKWLGHRDYNTTFRIYGHFIGAEPPSGYETETQKTTQPDTSRVARPVRRMFTGGKLVGATGLEPATS